MKLTTTIISLLYIGAATVFMAALSIAVIVALGFVELVNNTIK